MGKYIKVFKAHTDYESFIESDEYEYVRPNISYCMQESEVHYDEDPIDYSKKYLTYEILSDNTNVQITISKDFDTTAINYISYSTDNGNSWTTINNEDGKSNDLTHSFVANKGDYIMWRAEAQTISAYNSSADGGYINGCKIQCNNEYNVFGNIMSLLYGNNFYGKYSLIDRAYCFTGLFKNEPIVSAENFILPTTTLTESCYQYMFQYCINLTIAPILPATTLADYCYNRMFEGCINLTMAPELPATTLAQYCYQGMFNGCTSLTTAPMLPAITLADNCYQSMFENCTSLTTAPELSATTLADYCCCNMFRSCTGLTTAPELYATILTKNCYSYMFYGCTNLKYIKAMFTTTPSTTYTNAWVYGVAVNGTFVKNSAATWNVIGVMGIPLGWTVQTANN